MHLLANAVRPGFPVASTFPASIATSCSKRSASSMYAVATSTLMPGRRLRIRSISSQNCRRESGSTPVVGSSRMSRSGSCINEQHNPSFCFIPPDSLPAGRARNGDKAVLASNSSIRAARSPAD